MNLTNTQNTHISVHIIVHDSCIQNSCEYSSSLNLHMNIIARMLALSRGNGIINRSTLTSVNVFFTN